jgi:hypothetical protein
MSIYFRLIVPLIQVSLAGGLIVGFRTPPRHDFDKIEWQLCWALNAPAFILAEIPIRIYRTVFQVENLIFETSAQLCFIWLVWYAVALESGGRGRSVLSARTRVPALMDVPAMILGVMVGLCTTSIAQLRMLYPIWTIAIVGFYGHDLWMSLRGERKHDL